MLTLRHSVGLSVLGFSSLLWLAPACGADDASSPGTSTGGTPSSGSGGAGTSTGGAGPKATGGAAPTGGAPAGNGGSSATGGMQGSGGSAAGGTTDGGTPGVTGGAPTGNGGTPGATGGAPTGNGGSPGATGGAPTGNGGSPGGSGGTPGGNGGAPTGNGGSPGGGGMPPAGSDLISEDFESHTVGKAPTGWDFFVAWNKNLNNPAGETLALVDDTRARSGTKSMHFHGGGEPAMITRPLPMGTNKLYVRAYFYMTRQLGQVPDANHETLIGIRGKTGAADDEIRFGEIKGVIGTNEVPSDNISPKQDQWGKGPVIPANAWQCIEVAFLGDDDNHELYAWHNGTEVHSVTAPDQWNNGNLSPTWMNGKFLEVIVGWHSFSGDTNDVWMDDLVLSNERIGCE